MPATISMCAPDPPRQQNFHNWRYAQARTEHQARAAAGVLPVAPDRLRYGDRMTVKDRLRHAVETMSDEEARVALQTLAEASGDPVAWMLDHAPLDDEPETEEERQAVAEAIADRKRGVKPVALEDVLAEFRAT